MDFYRYVQDPVNAYGEFATAFDDEHCFGGQIINGLSSTTWIERYRNAGEFKFVAPVAFGHKQLLPVGTMISHIDTYEVMVVEDHEIVVDENTEMENIVITGRSMETILENRVVDDNDGETEVVSQAHYIGADFTWIQATVLFIDHLVPPMADTGDTYPGVSTAFNISEWDTLIEHPASEREVQRGTLYERLLEILAIDDLGIKVVRPGPGRTTFTYGDSGDTYFVFHDGVFRGDEVVFSHFSDDLKTAEYFWSERGYRNMMVVFTTWLKAKYKWPDEADILNAARRIGYIDASWIDEDFDVAPTGGDLTAALATMEVVAIQELAKQSRTALIKVEVNPNNTRYQYRKDYNIGDIVTVVGEYETSSRAKVIEYVEIEDESGEYSYPTLSIVRTPVPIP